MGLLNINEQAVVALDSIKSDAPSTVRHGEWWKHLDATAGKFVSGEIAAGGYIELARFTSPAGARVKAKNLESKVLPQAAVGSFDFKPQTWLDDNGKRHSSLYGTFSVAVKAADVAAAATTEEVLDAHLLD